MASHVPLLYYVRVPSSSRVVVVVVVAGKDGQGMMALTGIWGRSSKHTGSRLLVPRTWPCKPQLPTYLCSYV